MIGKFLNKKYNQSYIMLNNLFIKPFKEKNLTRFLLLLVVILALAAGFFQVSYELEAKKYKKLEDKYVRVRDMLGREKTQELIDLSFENEEK